MTQRNPTPPGMQDEVMLGEVLRGDALSASITQPVAPPKQPKIQDWLKSDHQRNALLRDVEQLKRGIGRVELLLAGLMALLVLVLATLLLLWRAGL